MKKPKTKAVRNAGVSTGKKRGPKGPNSTSFKAGNPWRWPKGVSANPSGANGLMAGYFKAYAAAPCPDSPGLTNGQAVVIAVAQRAQAGDIPAAVEFRRAVDDVSDSSTGEVHVYLGPDDYDPTKPAPQPADPPAHQPADPPAGDA